MKNSYYKPRTLDEARCSFQASENDVLDLLLYYVKMENDSPENLTYTLIIDDFRYFFGLKYSKNVYQRVRVGLSHLRDRFITLWSADGTGYKSYRLFQSVEWLDGQGIVKITLEKDIKDLLVEQKPLMVDYNIRHTLLMDSKYSKRFYLLFKIWAKKQEKEHYSSLEELREILLIPDSYRYGNIKEKVLEIAFGEINGNTDINVSYSEQLCPVKGGMKVIGFIFRIEGG